jgi:DNA primase
MAFPPGFLDALRERISLSQLIGRRVKLERRGREYAGLCPFHHEKTPSFFVVEDKAFFHCFGCGAHGDAIGFLMRAERLDFIEAVERLAGEAGLPMPRPSPEEREHAQKQKGLVDALEAACAYYEAQLWAPGGRTAREYLKARGLDAETIRNFRLGWAPSDRSALLRALCGEFPEALLVEAGLARRSEEGGAFAYFRDRIVFPIADRRGRVIAFGGRLIAAGEPKYLNSPETPLFQKGRVLYGSAQAAAAARTEGGKGKLVVVEGYMDVLALHRCGFRGAVAPLGTALGEEQLALLWRLSPEPILCFDGDSAGQSAAHRALKRALPLLRPGQSLSFAVLPSGEDPDSLIRLSGRAAFEEVLVAARPMDQMLWQHELSLGSTKHASGEADLRKRLEDDWKEIADPNFQKAYRRYFQTQLDKIFPWRSPQQKRNTGRPQPGAVHDGPPPPPRSPGRVKHEIRFRILLRFPEVLGEVAEEFAALDLREGELDTLRRTILETFKSQPGLDARALQQHLVRCGLAATVERLLEPSVDTRFVDRLSDAPSARRAWDHVVGMLAGGGQKALAEVACEILSEDSPESWNQRVSAAREPLLRRPPHAEEEGF